MTPINSSPGRSSALSSLAQHTLASVSTLNNAPKRAIALQRNLYRLTLNPITTAIVRYFEPQSAPYHQRLGETSTYLPKETRSYTLKIEKPRDRQVPEKNFGPAENFAAELINNTLDPYIKRFEGDNKVLKILRKFNFVNERPRATQIAISLKKSTRKFLKEALTSVNGTDDVETQKAIDRALILTGVYVVSNYFFSEKSSENVSRWAGEIGFKILSTFKLSPIQLGLKDKAHFIVTPFSLAARGVTTYTSFLDILQKGPLPSPEELRAAEQEDGSTDIVEDEEFYLLFEARKVCLKSRPF